MPQVSSIERGPDTFRILLTTDNHVGYMETDPIRGDDSWKTFSEIMHLALDRDVDMVVQGGDLFHVNQPSKKSYYHVMQTLRETCWNEKPIEYRLVSDPSRAMAAKHFGYPCEYDPNINVGMPVYAISGNHDDSTGEELLSPLDLLSVSALLNHFGRVTNNDDIKVYPLLFNKGSTNLALYGLQSIREDRLKRTMASGNLEFLQPDTEDSVEWFNLMCIHQNHVQRPGIRAIQESQLPGFLDFILWGHEHDCIPHTEHNYTNDFDVLQAGSSVATSLIEGELSEKHVFLLSVKGKDYSLEPIALKSVRPFAMGSVVLAQTGLSATSANKTEVLNYLIEEVERLIAKATSKWKENNREEFESMELTDANIPLPLIRLRVEYSGGYDVENPRFFSNRFVGKVANVNDVLSLYRRKARGKDVISELVKETRAASDEGVVDVVEDTGDANIFNMIEGQLNDDELIVVSKKDFSHTLTDLISKDDKDVLGAFVHTEEEKSLGMLKQLAISDGNTDDVRKNFRKLAKRIRAEATFAQRSTASAPEPTNSPSPLPSPRALSPVEIVSDSDVEEIPKPTVKRRTRAKAKQKPKATPKSTRSTRSSRSSKLDTSPPPSNGLPTSLFDNLGKR